MKECQCEIVENHADMFGIPSLQALGFEEGNGVEIDQRVQNILRQGVPFTVAGWGNTGTRKNASQIQ